MSIKSQIQENNNLLSVDVLNAIAGLPTREMASQGQYVWKKMIKGGTLSFWVDWDGIYVESNDYDVSKITSDFWEFKSITGAGHVAIDFHDGWLEYFSSYENSEHCFDWIPEQGKMYIPDMSFDDFLDDLVVEEEFIGFAVNDNPNAYPDGGEQGGYWYERVKDDIKVAKGEITLSSTASTITIEHGLGIKPNAFILRGKKASLASNRTYFCYYPYGATNVDNYMSATYSQSSQKTANMNERTATFECRDSSYPFDATNYDWFAIAESGGQ